MIQIEVKSAEVQTKTGTSSKTGKAYQIAEQEAWGHFADQHGKPHPYPQKIRLTLEDGRAPYPVGTYTLAPESLYPDRFGQITIRAKLKPIAASLAKAAA